MKVSAVSFTSAKAVRSSEKCVNKPCSNPYKISDILPVTVGLSAGLMVAYILKTGKLDAAGKSLKKFMKIA